jgi:hypothetical protein
MVHFVAYMLASALSVKASAGLTVKLRADFHWLFLQVVELRGHLPADFHKPRGEGQGCPLPLGIAAGAEIIVEV